MLHVSLVQEVAGQHAAYAATGDRHTQAFAPAVGRYLAHLISRHGARGAQQVLAVKIPRRIPAAAVGKGFEHKGCIPGICLHFCGQRFLKQEGERSVIGMHIIIHADDGIRAQPSQLPAQQLHKVAAGVSKPCPDAGDCRRAPGLGLPGEGVLHGIRCSVVEVQIALARLAAALRLPLIAKAHETHPLRRDAEFLHGAVCLLHAQSLAFAGQGALACVIPIGGEEDVYLAGGHQILQYAADQQELIVLVRGKDQHLALRVAHLPRHKRHAAAPPAAPAQHQHHQENADTAQDGSRPRAHCFIPSPGPHGSRHKQKQHPHAHPHLCPSLAAAHKQQHRQQGGRYHDELCWCPR